MSRFFTGLLLGATVAGLTTAWASRILSDQEFYPQPVNHHPSEKNDSGPMSESQEVWSLDHPDFEAAGCTHPGKRRANNQDCFRLGEIQCGREGVGLLIVCDGMGGHAGGEVASQIATDLIWTVVSKQDDANPEMLQRSMQHAIERADAAIDQRASKEPELQGMGTTAVVASLHRDGYTHSYLGDSRLYQIRDGEIVYQTKDHSVVRFLVEEGIIKPEEAKDNPYRSQLTSSLGGGPNANRLTIEPKWEDKPGPHLEWEKGDWLVLCSDGLNSELEDDQIADIAKVGVSPEDVAIRLRDTVLEDTDARDNVTVIVARKK